MKNNKLYDLIKIISKETWISFKKQTWSWREIFYKLFTKNLKEKFIVIIISLFTFVYVRLQDVEERNLFVPLEIIKLDELTFVNDLPDNVSLFVSGTRSVFNSLDVNKIIASIDLAEITEEGTYQRTPIIKALPQGLQLLKISPNELTIELTDLDRKLLKIEPEIIDSPKRGFSVVRVRVKPSKLWVTGPQDVLNDITKLPTEPISIKDLDNDKEIVVGVNKNIHSGLGVDRDRKFNILIDIEPEYEEIIFNQNIPVKIFFDKDVNLVINNSIEITNAIYHVKREDAPGFNPLRDLSFTLDVSEVEYPGEYELSIIYQKRKGVRMSKYQPQKVQVKVFSKDK